MNTNATNTNKAAFPDLSGKVILAVDDVKFNTMLVEKMLTACNAKVVTLSNGHSTLEWLRENKPDLVILDLLMPDISGYDILTAIKSNPVTSDVPVLIASAFTARENLLQARDLGAVGYVKKPIVMSELFDQVRAVFHMDGMSVRDGMIIPQVPEKAIPVAPSFVG
ncbi:MAG: response regulator [Bacteroidales bacterium]|nr:response regulator [Candidatus Cryptobacteroides caccocaballi]